MQAVVRELGRLDALINNAGLADPADPPVEKLSLAVVDGGMTRKMIYV